MKQEKRINFWLGEKDLAKLDRQANEAKLTRSEYIRKLVREAKILPTPDVDYLAYADEFQRLGTLFNDCVKEYHSTGELDQVRAEAVWSEIKEKADRLRNELIEKTVDLKVEALHGKE